MSTLITIASSAAAVLLAAVVIAALKGISTVRDNTTAIRELGKSFGDHEKDVIRYRRDVEDRLRALERRRR